jgi:hypothetical protein
MTARHGFIKFASRSGSICDAISGSQAVEFTILCSLSNSAGADVCGPSRSALSHSQFVTFFALACAYRFARFIKLVPFGGERRWGNS